MLLECQRTNGSEYSHTEFIRSGKSGKKVPFTQGVMESQGKLGNLKVFA